MPITLYMDVHIPRAITVGLRLRSVDVITAQDDKSNNLSDPELLDRATKLQRILFTFDDDLLKEAAYRSQEKIPFAGVIYAHPLKISIGACVQDLEMIAKAGDSKDLANQVIFLPL
jgi:predicted nuclease of predicted toxin-antitoxin system